MLKQSLRALFAAGTVFTALCGASGADYQADVVIYGGSSGGITAALAAARNGKSVIVVEPTAHIGGMTTSGLGQVDIMRKETLGGITLEYFKRNAAEVENSRMYWVTPKAGEQTFLNMVNEEDGITLLRSSRLKEGEGAVTKDGSRIESITLENGDRVSGKIFIDGSYEGDLLAAAGISYIVGRESSAQYGESGAGIRPSLELPYADAYDENGELYPDLVEDVPGKLGDADPNTQAYNFRLCMTTDPANRIAAVKPENYNREDYHNLLKMVLAQPDRKWTFNDIISYWGLLSGGKKADINNRGDFSSDMINHSHNWAEASYAERDEIYKRHKDYTMGLLYFICNDPELPECLREDSSKWGLAADEFTDNGNWPHLLYVREARRMLGDYVMIQSDGYENNLKEDSIGIGSYMLDSHAVRKFVAPDGKVYIEGFISAFDGNRKVAVRPYEIPYRAILPKQSECENLMSVICLSASHVIYCSLRMEPVFMTVGEAAGVAAAMAIDGAIPVQEVNVPALQAKRQSAGGILHYPGGNRFPLKHELNGILLDNRDAELTGNWYFNEVGNPMVDGNLASAICNENNQVTASLKATIPAAGRYTVNAIICRAPYWNDPMPIELRINGVKHGEYTVKLDDLDMMFEKLDTIDLQEGDEVEFFITSGGDERVCVVDCFQLLPEGVEPYAK